MSRTLIDLDDEALGRAAHVLGTTTKAETVNRALQLVAESAGRQAERHRFDASWILSGTASPRPTSGRSRG
jgi:Arc/MetJ family transcription regulator